MTRRADHPHDHGHREGREGHREPPRDEGVDAHRRHRLRGVTPTGDGRLVATFCEGTTKMVGIARLVEERPRCIALSDTSVARGGEVVEEGLAVRWGNGLQLPSDALWEAGVEVDTPFDGLMAIAEAARLWGVSRSAVSQDIAKGTIQEGLEAVNFGKQWVLTRNAMLRVYGDPKTS